MSSTPTSPLADMMGRIGAAMAVKPGEIPDEFFIGRQGVSSDLYVFTTEKQAQGWLEAQVNLRRLWRMEHDLIGGWHPTEMELVPMVHAKLIVKGSEDD